MTSSGWVAGFKRTSVPLSDSFCDLEPLGHTSTHCLLPGPQDTPSSTVEKKGLLLSLLLRPHYWNSLSPRPGSLSALSLHHPGRSSMHAHCGTHSSVHGPSWCVMQRLCLDSVSGWEYSLPGILSLPTIVPVPQTLCSVISTLALQSNLFSAVSNPTL